jgi:hypothetical protein
VAAALAPAGRGGGVRGALLPLGAAAGDARTLLAAVGLALAALVAWLVVAERRQARRARTLAGPTPRAAPAGAVTGHPRCAWPGSPPPPPGSRGAEILALFGELRPGERLARWAIAWIGDEWQGAVRVGLEDAAGEPFEVELRRVAPGAPAPPARAGELGVYLLHVADGAATEEERGLGAMALASWLEGVGGAVPPWLRAHGAGRAG